MKTNRTLSFADLVELVNDLRQPFLLGQTMRVTTFAARVRAFQSAVWHMTLSDLRIDERKVVRQAADDLIEVINRNERMTLLELSNEYGWCEEDGEMPTLADLWEFCCHFAVDDLETVCVEIGTRLCEEAEANPQNMTFEDLLA